MLPVVFNEKMFDDLFDNDFFGGRNPLYGRHAKNLMSAHAAALSMSEISSLRM